jgi:hypothetical protein
MENTQAQLSTSAQAGINEHGTLLIRSGESQVILGATEAWHLLVWLYDNHRDRLSQLLRKAEEGKQARTHASTEPWTRFQGTLLECLEKAASLYSYTTQEDQGGHDWRVLVPRMEIGPFDRNVFMLAELLEIVKQRPEQAQQPAILEHDTSWVGETVKFAWIDEQANPNVWVFAKVYLQGKDKPVALIYRIDFEDEEGDYPEEEE